MAGDSSSDGDHKKLKLSKPKSLKKKHSKGKHSSSSSDDDHKKHKLTKPKSLKIKHSKGKHSSSSSSDDDGKKKLAKEKSLKDEHSHDKHSGSSSSDDDGHKQKLTKGESSKEEHSHDKHSSDSSSDEDGHKLKLTKVKSLKEEHSHDKHSGSSSSDEDGHKLKLKKVESSKDEHSHDKHSSSSSDEDGSKHKLKKLKHSGSSSSSSEGSHHHRDLEYDHSIIHYHDEEEYEVVSKNIAHEQIVEMLTIYGASAEGSRKEQFAEMLTIYGASGEEWHKVQIAEMLTMYGASAEERHKEQIVKMLTIYFAITVESHRERVVHMLTIYVSSTEESRKEQIFEMVSIYGASTEESHRERIARMLTMYAASTEESHRVQIVVMLRIYFASTEESHREQIVRMLTIYGTSSEESHREQIFRMLTVYGASTEVSHREQIVYMLTIYGACTEESHREQIARMVMSYGACTEESYREQIFRLLTFYDAFSEESHREQFFRMLTIYTSSTEESHREQIFRMLTIYASSTEESHREQIFEMVTIYGGSTEESDREQIVRMLTIYGSSTEEGHREQIVKMLTIYGASREESHREQIVYMLTIYGACTEESHREQIFRMLTVYGASTEESHREQIFKMLTIYGSSTEESHREQIIRMLTIYGSSTEESHREQIVHMLTIYGASTEESHREQIVRLLTIYGSSSEESRRGQIFRMLIIYGASREESHREQIAKLLTSYGASTEESDREQIVRMLTIYGSSTEESDREQIVRMLTIYGSSTEESQREQIFRMLTIYGSSTEENRREQIIRMLTIYGSSTEEKHREQIFRMLTIYGSSTEESHREQIVRMLTIYGASREESHRKQIVHMLTIYGASTEESHREQIFRMLTVYGACTEESHREQIFRMLTIYGASTEESHREQIFKILTIYGACTEEGHREQIVKMLTIYGTAEEESHRERITEMLTSYGASAEESHRERIVEALASYGAAEEESNNEQFASEERVEVLEQAKGIRDESEEGGVGAFEEESSSGGHETEGYHIAVSETISTPEPEPNVESPEPEDDFGEIQEAGDAEIVSSAQVTVDVIEKDEEALVENRETSEVISQEDEEHAESAATEVVAESESAFGEEALVENRETSAFEEEKHVESRSSVCMETEQVQLNLNSLHEPVFANAREIEGKSEHDEGRFVEEDEKEAGSHDVIMEVRQNKLLMPILAPSSASSAAKRLSSVYKIVMALEGTQVGEKCIHGEVDHGLCHHRHSDKKPSSPGSYSPSARLDWSRDSSVSPKAAVRGAAPLPEVRASSGESREVDNEWKFVQHDSTSGTQVLSGTTKTETYTDTLLFRKDDGFLLRTPGPSPLSQESMRTVVSQVEGSSSGSDTTKLNIVHEFSAEQQDIASEVTTVLEGESEVEKILRLQETHDLVCPVCRSCITKRVILRKRKRTSIVSSVETWDSQGVVDEEASFRGHVVVDNAGEQQAVVEEHEYYGCLNCFAILFCLERSTQRTKAVEVPQAPEEAPGTPVAATLPEPVAALPPSPIAKDYNNRCLPVFFTWRRKTTISTDSDIVAPLLSEDEREQDSSVVQTNIQDISSEDVLQHTSTKRKEISASEIQESSSFVTRHPDSGTITLPAAPGVVEGVQIPVVVVESKEDRLCFPFLWTRGTRTTQVHPELTEPLLTKEEVQPKSPKSPKFVEVEHQRALQAEDFDRIEDQWWMRREVCLEVPVSEPPREEEEARTPEPASVATSRVIEKERRVETERASVSEATEELQASTSTTGGSEITSSSLSFTDAVVLPVTSEGDVQTASLNCIEILVPSYPWGPPGEGRMQEVTEERRESAAAALPPFRFIRVAYPEYQSSRVLPVAESPEISALQPNQSVVVTQAVERREDSTCFPLSLPALSWRRAELISGEVADTSSETSTPVVKTIETKAPEPALLQEKPVQTELSFRDIETSRNQQEQSFNDGANELVEEEEEEEPLVRKSPAPKKPEAEPLPLPEPEPVVVHESVTVVSEETPEIIKSDLSFSPELTTAEVVVPATPPVLPAVGGDETKEKESVNCCLPLYSRPSYQPIEVAESVTTIQTATAASETLPESSISHIFDAVGTSETITEEQNRDTGSWNCCLPSYTQLAYQPPDAPVSDVLVGASASGFKTVHEEVTKETTIDARIKTEEKTTTFVTNEEHAESIESVRVDTTLSYVHGKVQHDNGDAEGTLHLDDHPTLSFHPVAMDFKPAPQQPAYVTGSAALSRFVEEDDETEVEVKESLAELPSQGVNKTEEEVQITEATEHDVGEEISVEQRGRQDDEEDGACCVPRSKWLWGRWNYTTSEAQLREPLLEVHSEPAHVEVQQKHEVTTTTTGDDTSVAVAEERCHCFPWTREVVTDTVSTTVTVRTNSDTVIEVDGSDATSTLAAASAAAEDAGMVMDEPPVKGEYLKSIVYGGLDVSLTSLGVVAAAAGGDAKMRNILALGLSNLIFGFLTFFYKILEMHNEGPARFQESVGARFWINGPLAMLSFLLFGALPVLTFALSFRHLNDHSFKMAATAFASLIAVVFLGCGKVAAKMTELSYKRTVSGLIMTGIVASVSAYFAGEFISKILAQAGIFDE